MENEKRLIYADDLRQHWLENGENEHIYDTNAFLDSIDEQPTVDAVEAPDKQLLKAIKLLIKQYEHSKQSDYVHNPIAHAFFHTWKQLDESGYGERRNKDER